jgi:hypothetical protein
MQLANDAGSRVVAAASTPAKLAVAHRMGQTSSSTIKTRTGSLMSFQLNVGDHHPGREFR